MMPHDKRTGRRGMRGTGEKQKEHEFLAMTRSYRHQGNMNNGEY